MILPDYWLTRPAMDMDPATRTAFDALLSTVSTGTDCPTIDCPTIDYEFDAPKWQFLCYAAEEHGMAVHGSGDPHIALFEPRQADDLHEFGNRKAVYAASDGIWPMFFAVVDRSRFAMSVNNACIRVEEPSGAVHGPYYVFSISRTVLPQKPWRTGTVYLLPRTTFAAQESLSFGPYRMHVAQLASLEAVPPLAKLTVTPEDFPFLAEIRAHDDHRLAEYSRVLQAGAPWPDDE